MEIFVDLWTGFSTLLYDGLIFLLFCFVFTIVIFIYIFVFTYEELKYLNTFFLYDKTGILVYKWTNPKDSEERIKASLLEYKNYVSQRNRWRWNLRKLLGETPTKYPYQLMDEYEQLLRECITVPKHKWANDRIQSCITHLAEIPSSIEAHEAALIACGYAIDEAVINPSTGFPWTVGDTASAVLSATSINRKFTLDLLLNRDLISKEKHQENLLFIKAHSNVVD